MSVQFGTQQGSPDTFYLLRVTGRRIICAEEIYPQENCLGNFSTEWLKSRSLSPSLHKYSPGLKLRSKVGTLSEGNAIHTRGKGVKLRPLEKSWSWLSEKLISRD